jgi:hypothetical protein
MHALAMLTDVVTDKHGSSIAPWQLYSIVQNTCVSVAAFRIKTLFKCEDVGKFEEVLIENLNETATYIGLKLNLKYSD